MKRTFVTVIAGLTLAVVSFAAKVGEPAPDFTGTDSNGKTEKLSDYKGKYVVLEWHNQGCPFVRKHYESGNMQKLQRDWTAKGVVWLSILSSAPGQQGFVSAAEENAYLKKMHATPTAAILDPKGAIGHLYSAKTTPQMVVIDPKGNIVYDGAIDDHASTDKADIPNSKNYVDAALKTAMAGERIDPGMTRPYGCSVKYAD
ncbi:MAG: thioredoxin family protein [Acidobacteriaceae bacterium]